MTADAVRDRRTQYETAGLDVADVDPDPMVEWRRWHDAASEASLPEPNAMTLSTVGLDGAPDARVVLVRGADARGLAFRVQVLNGIEGHNVPTGFSAERPVFVRVAVSDAADHVLYRSGDFDPNGDLRDEH